MSPDTNQTKLRAGEAKAPTGSEFVAPDCRGMNFYRADRALQDLLTIYMPAELRAHLEPHFDKLGELAGNRLDELAAIADKHGPVLHPRDRFGRDQDWIEYHPAYREMEQIAFADLGMHAMSHRPGVLGWNAKMPPVGKYMFQYLFVQAEFGLMCPVSVSDTSNFVISRYGSEALKKYLLPRLLSTDPKTMWKATQFMTEKAGGSDVGALETIAKPLGKSADGIERYALHGEKWFCSHADADVAVLLARPENAAAGTRGLGLFAMPRHLEDGSRNAYRIVRLKDKLGTKSMASGEICFEGATAYLIGDAKNGFKQMMDQVNLSRLSHGVRAAAMMRRCLNEALVVARSRRAFGQAIVAFPLLRRQLMKIMLPTEQALSMALYSTHVMGKADGGQADAGDANAQTLLRTLTPLFKFRACRDNIRVASHALEARGGTGYIEEWVSARLYRDAQIGTIWEGTSNINALDVIGRAIGKSGGGEALGRALHDKLDDAKALPGQFRGRVAALIDRAIRFAAEVAADPAKEKLSRAAASSLYHAVSAALLAAEGAATGAAGGDARRLLLAKLVVDHRLSASDPFAPQADSNEDAMVDLLLDDAAVPLARAVALIAG
ncbi:MAG: acyl-CoA dehydrogenase family protein [Rhodospirillales bacterium]